jgi:hypothetical protein
VVCAVRDGNFYICMKKVYQINLILKGGRNFCFPFSSGVFQFQVFAFFDGQDGKIYCEM